MSLSMVCLAITYWGLQHNKPGSGPAQAVFLFVFNTFFALGWLGMTWLYPAEIVPLRIRAPTNALSTRYEYPSCFYKSTVKQRANSLSANWIFNFLVVMITPVAFKTIGYRTYVIFAVMYVTSRIKKL